MNARLKLNMMFPNQLTFDQVEDLDKNITNDEIKDAVWACGENKSPDPDGYTFEFFRQYWDIIGSEFCVAVDWFFVSGTFPSGCNPSFIALIPKVMDAKFVTDFRPISLIGSVYKVITKILANRLSTVISDLVSNTQSTFVKDRSRRMGPSKRIPLHLNLNQSRGRDELIKSSSTRLINNRIESFLFGMHLIEISQNYRLPIPPYPVIRHPSQEMSEEINIQTFLKKFNHISFGEMPKVLSQAWEKFFEIQHAQPEDTNELLHKLLEDLQIIKNSSNAITTILPTKEPEYSLSMGDEHLSTIPKTESDEVIKSSVKNLVPIPSEYEVTSDYEKDVPMENFKIYLNPLFDDEEINSNKIDTHYFNAKSNLIESLSNRDTSFDSSPKFDYLKEFSGELMPTSITHANTIIENLSTSPIPVMDSDSLREEIDIFTENEDKVFKPGILSYLLVSHRDKINFDFSENPMIILVEPFVLASKSDVLVRVMTIGSARLKETLEDLKELVEYKESLENSSKEIVVSNSNEEKEEPPQNSNIRQLIREECCVEVCEEQKQKMEDTILDALNSKLLSINSQRLDKTEQVIRKSSTFLKDTSQISPVHAVAPILSTEEPEHSLSMGYEHLSITPETKSDEVTESNAKNLLSIPNPHCFNVESDFVESLLNSDTFIDSSSIFDFSGELAHVNPEITEFDFDFEEEIHLIENLLYDNSSSQPPKEHNADEERIKREHAEYISRMEMLFTINPRPRPTMNANTIIESLSSLSIPVQDSDSQREEIDIVTNTDDVLPPSVENDDDSEGEINVVEELLSDNSIPFTEDEASYSDYQDDLSFPRPPPEPPDAEFDFKPDVGKEILVVMYEKDEFDVFNDENDDYFPFMFVIR
nr:transposon TX1 putative 149 kDa protein [Tanacetum cinerariifolium]